MSSYWASRKLNWLITGCSSGLGLTLARLATDWGHLVIATARDPSKVPSLASELESTGGKLLPLDVTSFNSSDIFDQLASQGIVVDVLVNNAGRSCHSAVESFSEDEARDMLELNYLGPYRLLRRAIGDMRERRSGMVVNIGSGAGVDGRESMGIYGASKAAMDTLFRILGREVSPFNVRTLNVILGSLDTPFTSNVEHSKSPLADDYKDGMVGRVMNSIAHGWVPQGDVNKAAGVIYEMVILEGVGVGKKDERLMMLGRDMNRAWDGVIDRHTHAKEVFFGISDSIQRGDI